MADKKRGKLRIFLGYTEGVGRTLAMLKAAQEEHRSGVAILAGTIEHSEHPKIRAMLERMEYLAPQLLSPKDFDSLIFDLDQAIRSKPDLILLDGLAHTNVAGSRHRTRYKDIEELLRAGIHVYTTVHIAHIESLADKIASITGIPVQERIPDSVFERADQVELVDVDSPDPKDRPTLIALREIALRYTADQLKRIAAHISGQVMDTSFYTKDHILVCLSSAPSNQQVIRAAARMAEAFHGTFTALFVETPQTARLTPADKSVLRDNLKLAEQLGAQLATVYGEDIPAQIAEYAATSRVSKIVMGRSHHKRRWLSPTNLVDKLTASAPNMDIYIIPDTGSSRFKRTPAYTNPQKLSLADTAITLGILTGCTLIGLWFYFLGFREANIITVYILGVLLNAMLTKGRLYSAVTSLLSVLVFNYFFTEPYFSLQAYGSGYPVTFLVMLTASFITSTLTMRVKEQARQSAQKAYRTEVLLETSRKLQQAQDIPAIINETAQQMVKLLDRTVIFYAAQQSSLSAPLIFSRQGAVVEPQAYTAGYEREVADWVYKNNKRAGATTDTFSGASGLYHAVRGRDTVFAVAAIVMEQGNPLDAFEQSLMIAMLGECALALEKELLNAKQKEISLQIQQEQLRTNLLRAISHDLRTPLTSISGHAGILIGNSKVLGEQQKQELYTDIYDDSMWLINLVENLLSITRMDNGAVQLQLQGELLEEVIAEALLHVNRNSKDHTIITVVEEELLMARMDSRLMVQVLINIVDNAIKYTQTGSHITIAARRDQQMVVVEISDDGPGISEEAKSKLFDMFYTANNLRGDGRRGLGLGLSLCKSIVHAHGGELEVQNNDPQGTVFRFTLQAEEVTVHE
ncbi:sensor histidine kinase [Paenibacillus donghaensis]|uniref:histidine kinase n=1 Tax=Paenibacillus donghaensis TaxID=414771 RepID=A0A2Z2KR98_9BACL|nr:sensor histidine kinase KdpD [Paenibacillus donghaensis]ASA21488.1 histidine kinase [Paenibacillus donghaensis]